MVGFSEVTLFNVLKTLELLMSLVEECPTNQRLKNAIVNPNSLSHLVTVAMESTAQCQILANRILQHIINFDGFEED